MVRDGLDGSDGNDGRDALCHGNRPPVFEAARFETLPGVPFRRHQARTLWLDIVDPDGDPLSVDFAGVGATFEPAGENHAYAVTPKMEGGPFLFTASISDGCSVVAGSFSIQRVDAAPYVLPVFFTLNNPAKIWVALADGTMEDDGTVPGLKGVRGVAIHPIDGRVFVHTHDHGATDGLYRFDPMTRDVEFIGPTGLWVPDMAFSPDGTLYALDQDERELVTIDLATGESTTVVKVDRTVGAVGIAFRGETLYLKSRNDFYTVDLTTGTLTLVGTLELGEDLQNGLEYDAREDRFLSFRREGAETRVYTIDPVLFVAEQHVTVPDGNVTAVILFEPKLGDIELTAFPGPTTARIVWGGDPFIRAAFLSWSPNGPSHPIRINRDDSNVTELQLAFSEVDFDHQWYATGLEPESTYTFSLRLLDEANGLSEPVTTTVTTLPAPPQVAETLYGLEREGKLYQVDPATGAVTEIGDTGLSRTDAFAINSEDGKAYLVSNDTKKLYEVSLEDASVTEIMDTTVDNVRDLFVQADGKLGGSNRDSDLLTFDPETRDLVASAFAFLEWAVGLGRYDGDTFLKVRNDLVDPVSGDVVASVIGPLDYHLGNSLTFSSGGYAYSLSQNWDDDRNTLYRIDPGSFVATRIVTYEEDFRLTSVDFLLPTGE